MADKNLIIKSLNKTNGENLTLEKAKDRVEFEALMIPGITGNPAIHEGDCVVVCGDFGSGPSCNPMPTPDPPPVPDPTPVD